ncbi:MAG: AMP-binding protein [Novosphingobium sp.]|nr:AMP-binding protein [Novosphingobium sp.]
MTDRPPAPLLVERIREHARTIPASLAVRAPGGELTMAGLALRAERIAARLREEGCVPGDRVVVLGRPSLAWIEVMFGAGFARCGFAPVSTSLRVDELAGLLGDAGPKLIFADGEFAGQGGCPREITVQLQELDEWIAAGPGVGEPDIPQGDDLFSIIYSSGTTGVPKGIAHTAADRAEFVHGRGRPSLQPGKTSWVATSLYTNLSYLGIFSPLYWGAGISIPERFSVEGFLKACREERISEVGLVPVQVRRILDHPDFDPAALASLEFTMMSGSPVDLAVKRKLVECWPGRIVDAYGSTETGGIATLDIKGDPDKLDTVGKIIPGVEAAILDDDGNRLPTGEVGEIAAVTPRPMTGYFNRDDLTDDATWQDQQGRSFLRTGDVGFIDEDGYLRITGRSKDMIISGGLNIFAVDIEAALIEHPAVLEAAVIAVPSERWGESPHAIVALRQGESATVDKLMAWLSPRLARTSWPVGIDFVDELPRNALGKVLKRELREPFWADHERGVA